MALHVVDHPLVRHKLGLLRKESTSTSEFRMLAKEIARMLTYEASANMPTEKTNIEGWAGTVEVDTMAGKMVTIVPILRAGIGLMDGVLDMIPGAKISIVGLYRNEETLEPVEYYKKLAVVTHKDRRDILARVALKEPCNRIEEGALLAVQLQFQAVLARESNLHTRKEGREQAHQEDDEQRGQYISGLDHEWRIGT